MSTQPSSSFHVNVSSITGIAEAVAFIVTAVLVFIHDPKAGIDVAAIGAALHGIGHGLKTH